MARKFNLYRRYLAAGHAIKRIESCGVGVRQIAFGTGADGGGEAFWRTRVESELQDGEVPHLYQFGSMQIYLEDFNDWNILDREERERDAQEKREQFVRDMVSKYDDIIVARYSTGQTYLWMENPLDGFGVTINVGQALCERVLVGEDVTEVPDPELAEKALASVPRVKKVTPRYEYRCNDAELLGGAL